MCGIVAIHKLGRGRVQQEDLRRMAATLQHRGPDEAGYCMLGNGAVGMAHLRLSIIDLSTGQQPLFNPDTGSCIVFNGELYDHAVHRRALERLGHRFVTHSDTEVLLRLYDEHGLSFLDRLRGEFAFVLWDARRRRLVAARDALGVKPLFYRPGSHEVLFASEVKALFALPRVPRAVDPEFLASTFMGACPDNPSPFQGVKNLRPGHYLVVESGEVSEERRYFRLPLRELEEGLSFQDACAGVREHLGRAVQRRLVADVPVHVYLSGGLDSTLMLGLASEQGQRPHAYHIAFSGSEYRELSRASAAAEHYGAPLEVVECTLEQMGERLVQTVEHVESTVVNLNSSAKLMLSEYVRARGTKVCLTGEGADECFAGYAYFRLEAIWRQLEAGTLSSSAARAWLARFSATSPAEEGIHWDRSRAWKKSARPYGYPSFIQTKLDSLGTTPLKLLHPGLGLGAEHAPGQMLRRVLVPETLSALPPLNASRVHAFNSLAAYLIPALGDRVEMANSVECRLPMLDRDLVEFACRLPPEHLVDLGTMREKHVLREAFADLLPPALKADTKHAFLAPQWRELLRTPLGKELAAEYLGGPALKRAGLFRPGVVHGLRAASASVPSRTRRGRTIDVVLGAVLTTQILHDRFIRGPYRSQGNFRLAQRLSSAAPRLSMPSSA